MNMSPPHLEVQVLVMPTDRERRITNRIVSDVGARHDEFWVGRGT